MTLRSALTAIADVVEATGLQPPLRVLTASLREHDGSETGDRSAYFDDVQRVALLEPAAGVARAEYLVPLVISLRTSALGRFDQVVVPAEVGAAVARAIESTETWPAGVQAVITEAVDVLRSEENERDARLVISLAVTVVEGTN